MSNNWFQFKHFTIIQEKNPMKVSTDACIFGAWITEKVGGNFNVLDIGTGTGLLSLMWLQENPASRVMAIEPNVAAGEEALANFQSSLWSEKLDLCLSSLQSFAADGDRSKFDLIICNPPFFHNHLKSSDGLRNLARHDLLPAEVLADCSVQLIKEEGVLAVIYPEFYWEKWLKIANKFGWVEVQQLRVQPKCHKLTNRVCGLFVYEGLGEKYKQESLVIYERDGGYTKGFKKLLGKFYRDVFFDG